MTSVPGHGSASRSGGLARHYASTDPRADGWAALVGNRDVVVSHGWGGSGRTIGPAVAEEAARSVLRGPDHVDPLAAHGWWWP